MSDFHERLIRMAHNFLTQTGEVGITEVRVTRKAWEALQLYVDTRRTYLYPSTSVITEDANGPRIDFIDFAIDGEHRVTVRGPE